MGLGHVVGITNQLVGLNSSVWNQGSGDSESKARFHFQMFSIDHMRYQA